MRDPDYDEVRRIQHDIHKALYSLQDIHEALNPLQGIQSAGEKMQEMERRKAEAMNPAMYIDTRENAAQSAS